MHRLSYVSGTGGVEACLDCRSALAGTAAGIRGREWEYTIGYMSLSGAARAARECSLSVSFMRLASADELRRLNDRRYEDSRIAELVTVIEQETAALKE